ncbi:Uncharacterised protein [Halioglobus japonicus]|nr:Uncharacterised protein [Halioglobus japonicus]CAA0117814.1 Uncharacterised protein [Halioglobus japonicus]
MTTKPNEFERQQLEEISKAGLFHFRWLVATILAFGAIFVVPTSFQIMVAVPAGILLIGLGISHINQQFFQECPRCNAKLVRTSPTCTGCGLELLLDQSRRNSSGWGA